MTLSNEGDNGAHKTKNKIDIGVVDLSDHICIPICPIGSLLVDIRQGKQPTDRDEDKGGSY